MMTSNDPDDPRLNWAGLSQAERDAAYDNNKAVANSPALIAARNEASAKSRAAHATALDIPYGKRERTKIDLYPTRDTGLNAALKLTDREIAELSPLRLPIVRKPLAIVYGSAELPALVWDSRNFHAAREKAGAPGSLVVIEGADHFTILEELRRPHGALAKLALSLVKSG